MRTEKKKAASKKPVATKPAKAATKQTKASACSGFDAVTMATEVFAAASRFVQHYCRAYGLTSGADRALAVAFVRELQRETGGSAAVDTFGEAGPDAELLWISAKVLEGAASPGRVKAILIPPCIFH